MSKNKKSSVLNTNMTNHYLTEKNIKSFFFTLLLKCKLEQHLFSVTVITIRYSGRDQHYHIHLHSSRQKSNEVIYENSQNMVND